jgi:2-iminoacetate synthase
LDGFAALLSPAAAPHLEAMAQRAAGTTRARFGKAMQLYAPLYLSNACVNRCAYCGFSTKNQHIERRVLTREEIVTEGAALAAMGFGHVLLVAGEHPDIGVTVYAEALDALRPTFPNLSLEVQALETEEYRQLIAHGLYGVFLYQETYDPAIYKANHCGPKADMNYRLDAPDRMGEAGIHKIGLGALMGLGDWRLDTLALAQHLLHLKKRFWQTRFSISFPRLRPGTGLADPGKILSDHELTQLLCAWRCFDPDVELALSTRERADLRDNLLPLGLTCVSAGSSTAPGGYSTPNKDLEQFTIHDDRSPAQVANAIRKAGFTPVWKDWEAAYDR